MHDTGARDGEVLAWRWGEIRFDTRFIPIWHGIESGTVDKVKGTKTEIVRPAYLAERTNQELKICREETAFADGMDLALYPG